MRHNASFDVTPVFLAGMHKLTGNAPPMVRDAHVKGKNEYAMLEMQRFIERHGLSCFTMNPQFPFNSITLQRMLYAADRERHAVQFVESLLPAIWEEGIDVTTPERIGDAVNNAGFDAANLLQRAQAEEVNRGLATNTDRAVERGAFGIPTMYVGPKSGPQAMFFGKERLDQVKKELSA